MTPSTSKNPSRKRRWRIGETRTFQQWPLGKFVPDNAIGCIDGPPDHHENWSVLIELVDIKDGGTADEAEA